MNINHDVVEAIGNTPLIKLKQASEATGCTILGKAEFMNPGQSVKDRAGKWMILEAEKRGDLKPGGLVVEATAGNTGIGLGGRGERAWLPHADRHSGNPEPGKEGYCCGCAAPSSSRCRRCPTPTRTTISMSEGGWPIRLRKSEPNGVLFADQWNNLDNAKAHYESTGPEIWAADRRQGRRLHLLGRHRRHAGGRQPLSEGEEQGHRHRLRRSAGGRDV